MEQRRKKLGGRVMFPKEDNAPKGN